MEFILLPIPAAVVKLGSTEQVSVLEFVNAHKINGVRT